MNFEWITVLMSPACLTTTYSQDASPLFMIMAEKQSVHTCLHGVIYIYLIL